MDPVTLGMAKAATRRKTEALSRMVGVSDSAKPVYEHLHPSPPTIAYSNAVQLTPATKIEPLSGQVRLLGMVPKLSAQGYFVNDSAGQNTNTGAWAIEFDFYGSSFEAALRQEAVTSRVQWYVDDQPLTRDPVVPTAAAGLLYAQVTFAEPGWHRIRMIGRLIGLYNVRIPPGAAITPTPPKNLKVAIIGASFSWGYVGSFDQITAWPWKFARQADVEILQSAVSGSGYTLAPRYDLDSRVGAVAEWGPDLIIVEGSGNDATTSEADVKSAASSLFAKLDAKIPGTPVIVIGAMPRDNAQSHNDNRAKILRAVREAAQSASNVLEFVDPIGITEGLPAYATGGNYAAGARVLLSGAVYEAKEDTPSAPSVFNPNAWNLLSWFTGTGNSGSPAANGNRDVLLFTDGSHPTEAGSSYFATCILREVKGVLFREATKP